MWDAKYNYSHYRTLPGSADFDPATDVLHTLSGFQMCITRVRDSVRSHSIYFSS